MDRRWAKMRRLTLDALGHSDVLGLSANPLSIMQSAQLRANMSHAPVAGQDKIKAFQGWMDAGLHQVVFGYSGTWLHPYIGAAVEIAKRRAAGLADEKPITTDATPRANRLDTMCSLATTELQGICEAVSQQACRELAAGLLQGKTPKRIAARVANRVARVGKVRGRMLANTIVVSTHAGATLDAFRARGITHVGTIAERGPGARKRAMDGIVVLADRRTQPDLEDLDLVEVLTAGDDDVCQDCQDASDDGPWSLDEAEGMLPLHPNCRCAYIPSDDARFADVRDAGPDDEPRDEHGKWTEGGGGGGSSDRSARMLAQAHDVATKLNFDPNKISVSEGERALPHIKLEGGAMEYTSMESDLHGGTITVYPRHTDESKTEESVAHEIGHQKLQYYLGRTGIDPETAARQFSAQLSDPNISNYSSRWWEASKSGDQPWSNGCTRRSRKCLDCIIKQGRYLGLMTGRHFISV